MPNVYAFHAVQFSSGGGDVSSRVAPPYDVLSAAQKAAMLQSDARNIVAIDLPHTPAKELGPSSAYDAASTTFEAWLADGTLSARATPAIFAYRQTYAQGTRTIERTGMACTIDLVPFGPRADGGVLPHEETFSGPKEDRLALMKATRAQMSPIFGLHADEGGKASRLVRSVMSRAADQTARTPDGVLHELWTISDDATIHAYRNALAGEDVFVADGHHRYNTALNYLKHLESSGGAPADHPARRCMFVLISMSDPGLEIWPTHRVLGGMKDYSYDALLSAGGSLLRYEPIAGDLSALERAMHDLSGMGPIRFGLYDISTKRGCVAIPAFADPLAKRFGDKPAAWRSLDVAVVQHLLVEEICQPKLNARQPVTWAFPHTIAEVEELARGSETGSGGGNGFAQLAVIVRPTPLSAVRDISRAGVLMPQKSTFFYPKLATGLFVHLVR